jgi:REP element-mobilizing transposase RayT
MSRDLREEIAGGTFHTMNRGNRKVVIFEDDRDRWMFLRILFEALETYGVVLCALCLMGNHFHMIITTPYGNLADFMGAVEGRFASYSNWRHRHVGHLFQGRYIATVIDDDIHLLTALCYVFLNPLSAGLATKLEGYRWSTYRATAGFEATPNYLSLEWLRVLFPGDRLVAGQRRLHELMQCAKPVVEYQRQQELDVDPDALKRVIRSYVGEKLQLGSMPRRYRSVLRPSLQESLPADLFGASLARAIYEARVTDGYRVVEIARHLRMHRATVSKIFRNYIASKSK